jgi:COP9 signalosome complex subunit 4
MFLPAASKYLELSMVTDMHESERNAALKAAVTCTLLAGAGPQRNKMLATLYKDERLRKDPDLADSGHYSMLEKMVRGHVLQPKQVEEFSESLMEHQVAKFADGSTVLDR